MRVGLTQYTRPNVSNVVFYKRVGGTGRDLTNGYIKPSNALF